MRERGAVGAKVRSAWSLFLAGAALVACSSSTSGSGGGGSEAGPAFANQFCSKYTTCNMTLPANCSGSFAAIVTSSTCKSDLLGMSCADMASTTFPPWWDSCFPPCTGTSRTCNPDSTITGCSGGYELTDSCGGVCAANGLTYTGTCGTSYNGSTSVEPQCWCK